MHSINILLWHYIRSRWCDDVVLAINMHSLQYLTFATKPWICIAVTAPDICYKALHLLLCLALQQQLPTLL